MVQTLIIIVLIIISLAGLIVCFAEAKEINAKDNYYEKRINGNE